MTGQQLKQPPRYDVYNHAMPRWTLPLLLLAAFLGLTAYLSYHVATSFIAWKKVSDIANQYYTGSNEIEPRQINTILDELDITPGKSVKEEYVYIAVDLLTRRAWYYPESSLADLHLALEISEHHYGNNDYLDNRLARQITFSLAAAQLPGKVEQWQSEALAADPVSREYTRFMQIWSRLISDNETGARELLQAELGARRNLPNTQVLALVSHSLFGELDTAGQYEDVILSNGIGDFYFYYIYAWYLDELGRFDEAIDARAHVITFPPANADDAMWCALPLAGLDGIDDPQVQALLDLATGTTRRILSRAGAEALTLSDLVRITGEKSHLERLLALRSEHPEDGIIALAVAMAAVSHHEQMLKATAEAEVTEAAVAEDQLAALFDRPLLEYVQAAVDCAAQNSVRQQANLLMAAALVTPREEKQPAAEDRIRSLVHLARALGDPNVEDSVITDRVPDYENFLLSDCVKTARSSDEEYDAGVNTLIIDYLNRRQEQFSDIYALPPLPYRGM